jgi:hypothetical protein
MRLEVDSGSQYVIALLNLSNNFDRQNRFAIDCYKGVHGENRIPCDAVPQTIILASKRVKRVKVKMPVDSDGLYRICSIEDPAEDEQRTLVTRICSIVGVGVNPDSSPSLSPKYRATTDAMATGARSR